MTLTYSLEEEDYLQYLLFVASHSARIKRQRIRNWLFNSAALIMLSLLFYISKGNLFAAYFLFYGLCILFFYPLYQRSLYKRVYRSVTAESYKNRFGLLETISFSENFVETKDIIGESKINLSAFENIIETGNYFYLKLRTGFHLIIPKSKIIGSGELRDLLKNICSRLSIQFISELNWKWK